MSRCKKGMVHVNSEFCKNNFELGDQCTVEVKRVYPAACCTLRTDCRQWNAFVKILKEFMRCDHGTVNLNSILWCTSINNLKPNVRPGSRKSPCRLTG